MIISNEDKPCIRFRIEEAGNTLEALASSLLLWSTVKCWSWDLGDDSLDISRFLKNSSRNQSDILWLTSVVLHMVCSNASCSDLSCKEVGVKLDSYDVHISQSSPGKQN